MPLIKPKIENIILEAGQFEIISRSYDNYTTTKKLTLTPKFKPKEILIIQKSWTNNNNDVAFLRWKESVGAVEYLCTNGQNFMSLNPTVTISDNQTNINLNTLNTSATGRLWGQYVIVLCGEEQDF